MTFHVLMDVDFNQACVALVGESATGISHLSRHVTVLSCFGSLLCVSIAHRVVGIRTEM